MEGICEGLNTKFLTMSCLFSFEMFCNSTTLCCLSSALSCFIFSLDSSSFLSFSSLAFLKFSSLAFLKFSCLAFSSSSLFFLSFISFSSCSLLAQSFSSSSFSFLFSYSRSFLSFSYSLLCFSLFFCSLKSKSKLYLKSFCSLEKLARFWINASPMSMKFSILVCCSFVILNEGGMKCFYMHVFNSENVLIHDFLPFFTYTASLATTQIHVLQT